MDVNPNHFDAIFTAKPAKKSLLQRGILNNFVMFTIPFIPQKAFAMTLGAANIASPGSILTMIGSTILGTFCVITAISFVGFGAWSFPWYVVEGIFNDLKNGLFFNFWTAP